MNKNDNLHIRHSATENSIDTSILHGTNILLVEDNIINQDVARAMLNQRRMNVDIAENGEQAVEMVKNGNYDCVLMDLQMPVMDGNTATRIIREELQNSRLPILAMTAKVLDSDIREALDSGMNCHIPKPINLKLLLTEIEYWVKKSRLLPATAIKSEKDQGKIMANCLENSGGNKELFIKVLTVFIEKHSSDYAQVKDFLKEKNIMEARRVIHALNGVSQLVGAGKLHEISVELESLLVEEKIEDTTQLLENLNSSLQDSVAYIKKYIAKNS
ncbi:MAG: hypothetical protein DSY80_04690 [Desulfocapsa sp.]|nr:MAG: hypothetical protein DSY80_04690 [Desulfocapsa sp.]